MRRRKPKPAKPVTRSDPSIKKIRNRTVLLSRAGAMERLKGYHRDRAFTDACVDRALLLREFDASQTRVRQLMEASGKISQEREQLLIFAGEIISDENADKKYRTRARALLVWSTRSIADYKRHELAHVQAAIEGLEKKEETGESVDESEVESICSEPAITDEPLGKAQ